VKPKPIRDGVVASRLQLPQGPWATVCEALVARFPAIGADAWRDRIARRRVLDADGVPIDAATPYRAGAEVHYWREVVDEPRIEAAESVVHADEHLVVADKPHGLPVTPSGGSVRETLLARLVRRLGNPHLVPLHRIDRDTVGLVLFSANPTSRAAYHALFRERRIDKRYEALAPPLPALAFPHVRRSRLVRGEPFFRTREIEGAANAETHLDVVARDGANWRYALQPVTGRHHQLRVHLAALGAPIIGDRLYAACPATDDVPLQLVAKSLAFEDPLDGHARRYESGFALGNARGVPLSGLVSSLVCPYIVRVAKTGYTIESPEHSRTIAMAKIADAVVRSRVPADLKLRAERTLAKMGISVSDAFRLFLVQTTAQGRLPFDVKAPNARTRAAMRDAERGIGKRFASVDELLEELDADDAKD